MIILSTIVTACSSDNINVNDTPENSKTVNLSENHMAKDNLVIPVIELEDIESIGLDTLAQGINYFTLNDIQTIKKVYNIYLKNCDCEDCGDVVGPDSDGLSHMLLAEVKLKNNSIIHIDFFQADTKCYMVLYKHLINSDGTYVVQQRINGRTQKRVVGKTIEITAEDFNAINSVIPHVLYESDGFKELNCVGKYKDLVDEYSSGHLFLQNDSDDSITIVGIFSKR